MACRKTKTMKLMFVWCRLTNVRWRIDGGNAYSRIALLLASPYMMKMAVLRDQTLIYLIISLINIEAASYFIKPAFIKPHRIGRIQNREFSRLHTASRKSFPVTGTILLHVRIGKLCVHARLTTANSFAVDLLLGISFINFHIQESFWGNTAFSHEVHRSWHLSSRPMR